MSKPALTTARIPIKHGDKVYKPGTHLEFNTICDLANFINNATYESPNPAIHGKSIVFNDIDTVRGTIEQWEKEAAAAGCPITRSNLYIQPRQISPADGKKISEDSSGQLGAPEPEEHVVRAEGTATSEPQSENTDQQTGTYGPFPGEVQREPHGGPFSSEESGETTQGGDPVDLFRGSFTIQETDLVIPQTILPLAFTRTYRSGNPFPGPFSWNWDHNHNIYLRELTPEEGQTTGGVARWNGALREDVFVWNGEDYEPPRGIFQKLEKLGSVHPDGEYAIHDAGGTSWFFDRPSAWTNDYRIPLRRIRDRFGNVLEYSYDSENRLERVTCIPVNDEGVPTSGPHHFLEFTYGNCGLLERVGDSIGREVEYYHDPDIQHLIGVRYPAPTRGSAERMEKRYQYGGLHLPEMLRHNIVRVENGKGEVHIQNLYDEDPSSWSYGHVLQQFHGKYLYRFQYTPLQWLPPHDDYVNIPTQRTEIIDPEGGLTTYTFNFRGNVLDRRTRLAEDGSFWITAMAFEYDSQGNQTRAQHLRDFEDSGLGTIAHLWGLGERRTYHPDHSDPRMRGMVKKLERLDGGAMSELIWEGTYDPDFQLLLTEHGQAGDGFSAGDLTTVYHYSTDSRKMLEKIVHPDATLPDDTTQSIETQFETNARGQIIAIITPEGIRHELEYVETTGLGLGRLLKKIADAGSGGIAAEQIFVYDDFGFLETVTDPSGAVSRYTYDALGHLLESAPPEIEGSAPATLMSYDADGLLVEVRRPRGNYADGIIQGDHIVDRIVRNIIGHVERSEIGANSVTPRITRRKVDHRGLPLSSTDPLDVISRWQYDERGLLFRHEVKGRDGAESRERFVYTRDGRMHREIYGPAGDTVVEYVYGPHGRVARTHHLHRAADGTQTPAGATECNHWSERGLLERSELRSYPGLSDDDLLARTEFRYDEHGRFIEKIERPFSTDDPFDDDTTPKLITQFFYDRDDRLVKVIDPRGGEMLYSYDGLGRVLSEEDAEGNRAEYAYDLGERSVEITRRDIGTGGTLEPPRVWKQKSDARGRLVEAVEPDEAVTQFEYDDRDLLIATVNREGKRREYTYGLLNELVKDVLDPSGLNIINEWSYDLVGRMITYKDPSGQITTYDYDSIGRLVRSLQPGDIAPRTMTYRSDGRLATSRLPSGISFSYGYDNTGRMAYMAATNVPTGIDTVPQHNYSYDLLGRLTTATAGSSTVTRAYDSFGRLLRETTHGETLETAYNDLAGTFVRMWPDGRQETHATNLNGVVTSIERTAAGSLGAGGSALGDFTPYGPGLISKASLLGGIDTTIEYDERKRVSQVRHEGGSTVLEQVDYRYDTMDRRRVELIGTGTVQSRLHLFDSRHRLIETCEGSGAVTLGTGGYTQDDNDDDIAAVQTALGLQTPQPIKYEYLFLQLNTGKADERLTLRKTNSAGTATSTEYVYDTGHRASFAGSESFTHLADGTRTSDTNNGYAVDALGRVTRVLDPAGSPTKTAIDYDALGRVATITPAAGAARNLSYFGGSLWQERGTSGAVRQFSHHHGLPGPLAAHVSGETYLMHHDARLNLTAVTDSSGTLQQRYRYEPFGTPSPATSATGIEPRFGGMRWLNDTGLYLAGARMMDPRHGLWLSHDPLGSVDSPNLYAYARQNPIDYADPSGLAAGKAGGSGNSDGGIIGPGSGYIGTPDISMPGGTSKRSAFYGAGDGPGVGGPEWLISMTEGLRSISTTVRKWAHGIVDSTLGQLGEVGKFFGGMVKRVVDLNLMFTPLGFSILEEEAMGYISMYGMGVDAMFNPDPGRYQRLGNMISQLPEYFAHMSAEEWGSFAVDALPALITGGLGMVRVAKAGWKAGARGLAKSGMRAAKEGGDDLIRFYHGTTKSGASSIRSNGIDLSFSRTKTDFGRGFYTTTDRAQAQIWAAARDGEVLEFSVSRQALAGLNGLDMGAKTQPSLFRFFRHNRLGGRMHSYDAVSGPMLGNPGSFLRGKPGRIVGQQTSFHTQDAIDLLYQGLQP